MNHFNTIKRKYKITDIGELDVEIDNYPSRYDLGYKNMVDFRKANIQLAEETAMKNIAKYASQGDRMMRIENKGNALQDVISEDYTPAEKRVGLKWIRGPKFNVIPPDLKINYTPAKPEINVKINQPEIQYQQGQVDIRMALTKSKKKANRALEVVKEIVEDKLKLTLHPEKTVITNFGKGFVFLGFEFINWRYKRPKKKALKSFEDKVRKVTRRNQPWDIGFIIRELNPKIVGWGNYFGHGNVKGLFQRLDEWIRMRLRSYIEKKKAIKHQNQRIPNAVLQQKGLKSLLTLLS